MTYGDLTPEEREALSLLRANDPNAPEALGSLDDAGRARVLEALSDAATDVRESGDAVEAATDDLPGEAVDDEPTLDSAPTPQSSTPSTLVDRLLAPNVDVAGKQVPLVPTAIGVVLVLVVLVLLVRACTSGGDPLESLSKAGAEAVDSLDDLADEVDDDRLFDAADRVREDMRTLLREADADYGDFREVLAAGEAVAELGSEILYFVEVAADSVERAFDEEAAQAAANAARLAGRLVTNGEALDQAESLAESLLDTHLSENARRADSDDAAEFRRAARDLIVAARDNLVTRVGYHVARAELAAASMDGSNLDDARDAFDEARDAAQTALEDFIKAEDDFVYFGERVEWRPFQSFESSVPGEWRP